MARKHEKFSYNYGWRTAPEQWNFFYNGKRINLDSNTRNTLACMCLSGKVKEAEEILRDMICNGEENPPEECENSWCDNIQEMERTNSYESIEDKLEEIISNESVDMIEEFLGYELTFTAPEDIHSQVRDTLDQMPEEELLLWEEKYDLL